MAELSEGPLVIFDCNGVLVDSEPIASVVLAAAFSRVGVTLTPETVAREFHGRRTADIFVAVEKTTKRSLPPNFAATVAAETLRRFRDELQPIPHAAHALTWIRGPKAVASSSAPDRIRTSLEVTGLMRFFESRLFSGKPRRRRQAGPRPVSCRSHSARGRSRRLHRGRRFGSRNCRGQGRRHDCDRLHRLAACRRPYGAGTHGRRRPDGDRGHAGSGQHHHRTARLVALPRTASVPPRRGSYAHWLGLALGGAGLPFGFGFAGSFGSAASGSKPT